MSIIAEKLSIIGVLIFLFIMNKPIDKQQDAGMSYYNMLMSKHHIVFQSLNMTQVAIAIKFSQWENDISSRKIEKDHGKKGVARKSQNGC